MSKQIAILATLDTKGQEAEFLSEQLALLGSDAVLVDIGVTGEAATTADVTREQVAVAAGTTLDAILRNPTREAAAPLMAKGAIAVLSSRLERGELDGVLGLGGLQGTALCTEVMRALPYGLPKVMVSTVASGNTAPYVDIKDITMMFSVGDILGLNPFSRMLLARAAGAVHGMAITDAGSFTRRSDKPLIGMTNLGVLTKGALEAIQAFDEAGYEVITFHAVGSGGRAMEQMMKEGLIGAVFDYALGEISDQYFEGLRAGGPERLTVAGKLGLPQVICPGGAEHLGVLVDPPHTVPDRYRGHRHVFHNPVVFVPRLLPEQMVELAEEIAARLQHTTGKAVFMMPLGGTGSYAKEGGPLRDPEGDRQFFQALRDKLPKSIEIVERDTHAEDPAFVREAVARLLAMIEN
ncbi:MAG: Tm-1-like ATP-binding domain-containing protein [Planctomycetes bacterium]|nr:Tm-1-like ATP-binding domain-containing protein [Planctomycetota bacterium]MCB9870733.1 Tm-1-like ATP-binding domain-containing protein [Planctomycetota bacterium]MCB9889068.1 Tm-1-like ATP-binding domain-containing protein [Planctomycetota bacterium]